MVDDLLNFACFPIPRGIIIGGDYEPTGTARTYSKERENASLHLKHPKTLGYNDDLMIQHGDPITMSLRIPYTQIGAHVSVKCVEMLVAPRRREQGNPCYRLTLKMELWDVPRPYDFFLNTISSYDLSPITAAGTCGCVVRLHGRDFVITEEVEMCIEFPIIANGCEAHQKFEYVDA